MAVRVELGQMYTPEMGRQRGAVLLRAREREGIVVMLYREDRYYIITLIGHCPPL